MKNYNGINKLKPYLFLLPILVFACGFVYFPFARTFLYSFSRVNFRGDITGFTGTRNFNRLFGDPVFFTALKNTLTLTFFAVTFNLLISYSLALLANRKRKTSFIYETMFIIPMAVSMPAASQIFKMLLEPAMGIFNYRLGLKIGWFTDPSAALAGIVMVCVWIGIPFDFILFLSGLRNIPSNVMEAADLEGTGKLRRLFKLQLPLTAPTIFYVICTNIVLAMMTSTPVMIITAGQPSHSTTTLIFMMYTSGYQSSNYSIAACISLITFILTFGMVFLAFIFDSRKVHYQ
ncbi:MAG: sugar ABC transporter permease [Treponema sp.]|nr:sugar ABC transporter permease [Treponema sp.]